MNRRHFAAAAVLVGIAAFLPGVAQAAAPASTDWAAYLRGSDHTSTAFQAASNVTPSTVAQLHQKWSFSVPTISGRPRNSLNASPIVVGNRVYVGTGTGRFYALDAGTGRVAWSRDLDVLSTAQGGDCPRHGTEGTATAATEPGAGALTVYAPGARYLYALNATTGAVKWKRLVGPPNSANSAGFLNWG